MLFVMLMAVMMIRSYCVCYIRPFYYNISVIHFCTDLFYLTATGCSLIIFIVYFFATAFEVSALAPSAGAAGSGDGLTSA